ncbi:acyl-CoA thioesterase [Aerococcus sp. UMB7834]|uniref:acyl-CoA thioesterase n=1 Tax=Aerococcus sp. UMB7834 TaxID=3046342 RepID=UPI00254C8D2C|nr:acyl-CoA thioesterase [Aerococcus sp. UMB7834]MDK6805723.1 acyl-CoA thioesterase [Aerococcus sp. UMB7834]
MKHCKETRVVQTHRIMPQETNSFGNMFGGQLLSLVDNSASVSASRMSRTVVMTAAMDKMNFLAPLPENDSVCVESFVSGVGKKSCEVFVKVLGEHLATGERYIAATSFMTFVAITDDPDFHMPEIVADSEEEVMICSGYDQRRQERLNQRQADQALHEKLTKQVFWLDEDYYKSGN